MICEMKAMSAMRTLHAPCDVKVFRTLDESPRHRLASLGNTKKKKCSLLLCIFAGVIFF
jgi:hypothetical protein